jgi:hypothetical protein
MIGGKYKESIELRKLLFILNKEIQAKYIN